MQILIKSLWATVMQRLIRIPCVCACVCEGESEQRDPGVWPEGMKTAKISLTGGGVIR